MPNKNIDKIYHVGTIHKKVLSVAHESVRDQLRELELNDQSCKPTKIKWHLCKSRFLKNKSGWPCCQDFLNSPQELQLHLASAHYDNNLASAYGQPGFPCKQCQVDQQYLAIDKMDMVTHMISSHSHLFYKFMQEKNLLLLRQCISDNYKCPLCNYVNSGLTSIKVHLCRNHFKQSILETAKFKLGCQICEKWAFKKANALLNERSKCERARHLG